MQPDVENFQLFQLDADVVERSMGEDCLIYMDASPIQYLNSWKTIEIDFYDAITESSDTTKSLPDIMADDDGKLFLSNEAYQQLLPQIDAFGEALPIFYGKEKGYLFNVLRLAEEYDAVDKINTAHDNNGLVKLALNETALTGVNLFRTREDNYLGIYCSGEIKAAIDNKGLRGCKFNVNLVNLPA